MRVGAGKGRKGVVLVLTFGTGIGSGVFVDGALVPNTELGHVELDGAVAETWAAGRVQQEEGLSYKAWGRRVRRYLVHLERLFAPDLFIIGGGISKRFDRYADVLEHRDRDGSPPSCGIRRASSVLPWWLPTLLPSRR